MVSNTIKNICSKIFNKTVFHQGVETPVIFACPRGLKPPANKSAVPPALGRQRIGRGTTHLLTAEFIPYSESETPGREIGRASGTGSPRNARCTTYLLTAEFIPYSEG